MHNDHDDTPDQLTPDQIQDFQLGVDRLGSYLAALVGFPPKSRAVTPRGAPTDPASQIRQLKAENARLKARIALMEPVVEAARAWFATDDGAAAHDAYAALEQAVTTYTEATTKGAQS